VTYAEELIQAVWEKGNIVPNNDPTKWRKDDCQAWIGRLAYGDRNSQYGWEIDHITPESQGGTDQLSNLRPLQWQNNAARQEGNEECAVAASGKNNAPVA
jgi:hypothetical protein